MKALLVVSVLCFCAVQVHSWSVLKALNKHHLHKRRVKRDEGATGVAPADPAKLKQMDDDVKKAIAVVKEIRGGGYNSKVYMADFQNSPGDPAAVAAVKALQTATQQLLTAKYGKFLTTGGQPGHQQGKVVRIKMDVTFPDKMPDNAAKGASGTIVIETAPIEFMPHAVSVFLNIAQAWGGGAFHRNAGHVLQITTQGKQTGLTFQEYSPEFPHVPGTLGYAGRLGGPAFYISTIDNTQNHGPGSQGSTMGEADSCFARVLEGKDVVQRLFKIWGTKGAGFSADNMGFLASDSEHVKINSLTLLPGTA